MIKIAFLKYFLFFWPKHHERRTFGKTVFKHTVYQTIKEERIFRHGNFWLLYEFNVNILQYMKNLAKIKRPTTQMTNEYIFWSSPFSAEEFHPCSNTRPFIIIPFYFIRPLTKFINTTSYLFYLMKWASVGKSITNARLLHCFDLEQ